MEIHLESHLIAAHNVILINYSPRAKLCVCVCAGKYSCRYALMTLCAVQHRGVVKYRASAPRTLTLLWITYRETGMGIIMPSGGTLGGGGGGGNPMCAGQRYVLKGMQFNRFEWFLPAVCYWRV